VQENFSRPKYRLENKIGKHPEMHYVYMELIHLANESFQWLTILNNLIKCRINTSGRLFYYFSHTPFTEVNQLVTSIANHTYRGADKSLARPISRHILFDLRIFRLMLVFLYIYSTNIPPIMIINNIYEHQNLLS
jgi:hypothetical protein